MANHVCLQQTNMAKQVGSVACGASGLLWAWQENVCTFKRFQTWIRQVKEVNWYEQVFERQQNPL